MGVDVRLMIPAPARIRDVADVLAALLGCPVVRQDHGHGGSWSANCWGDVAFYRSENADDLIQPECVWININAPDDPRSFLYFFEWDAMGNHGLFPRSTASNIALCVAICDFFGGTVDFNDCDDVEVDYRQPVREDIHPHGGMPWENFQNRKLAIQPLTVADVVRYQSVAAYKTF